MAIIKYGLAISILLICITSHHYIFSRNSTNQSLSISNLALVPKQIAEVTVLEYKNIVSNYLFLNVLTFLGEKLLSGDQSENIEWGKIYSALDLITDLDPRAYDPYVLAQTTLPWEASMVDETNLLLLKAVKANPQNYRIYLFLWFNYFYFLEENEKAAFYLEKASKAPGAPKYYATLSARMHLYEGNILKGIIFLEELLKETYDPNRKKFLQNRLDALKKINFLEQKIKEFRTIYHIFPANLNMLIEKGLIENIPSDPYGGYFYIMDNGRVYTTSKLVQSNNGKSQ